MFAATAAVGCGAEDTAPAAAGAESTAGDGEGSLDTGAPDTADAGTAAGDGAPGDGGADAAADGGKEVAADVDEGPFVPADHPPTPLASKKSGTVLKQPRVVAVTYNADPRQADVDQFVAKLGATDYWQAVTAEYGVGPLVALPPIHLPVTATPSMTDKTIEEMVVASLSGAKPLWGAPNGNAIYAIFLPQNVKLAMADGSGNGCQSFGGYHNSVDVAGEEIPYAVILACKSWGGGAKSLLQSVTTTASHELIEAATDPRPLAQPAYLTTDVDHLAWGYTVGGEVGDLCTFAAPEPFLLPGLGYVVQRSWSNAAAKAGHDPCVPHLDDAPYFNSVPVLTDTVKIGGYIKTKGVTIPVGNSADVELDLFSDAPTDGDWDVSAEDYYTYITHGFGGAPELDFAFDRAHGHNGDKITMTITVNKMDTKWKAEPFVVISELGGRRNLWIGIVGN